MYNEPKDYITVRVKCLMCGYINKVVTVSVNKYGWFDMPDSLCPKCFCILDKVADGRNYT